MMTQRRPRHWLAVAAPTTAEARFGRFAEGWAITRLVTAWTLRVRVTIPLANMVALVTAHYLAIPVAFVVARHTATAIPLAAIAGLVRFAIATAAVIPFVASTGGRPCLNDGQK